MISAEARGQVWEKRDVRIGIRTEVLLDFLDSGGLCVNPNVFMLASGDRREAWVVTHVPSGRAIFPPGVPSLSSKDHAKAVGERLWLLCDWWNLSIDDIPEGLPAAVAEVVSAYIVEHPEAHWAHDVPEEGGPCGG